MVYYTPPTPAQKRGNRAEPDNGVAVHVAPVSASTYADTSKIAKRRRKRAAESFYDLATHRDRRAVAMGDARYFDVERARQLVSERQRKRSWWRNAFGESVCPECLACLGEVHAEDCELWPRLPGFRPIMERHDVDAIERVLNAQT